MSSVADPVKPAATSAAAPRLGFALAIVCIGVAMGTLDLTVVNVAIPSIRVALGADEATATWISAGFSLTTALTLVPGGRLGDRFGHVWMYVAGVALFSLASLVTGLAAGPAMIIGSRIAQGIGAGLIFPSAGALIQLMFTGRARGRALGIYGMVVSIGAATGGLLGGFVIGAFGAEYGWRILFFINLPVGLFAAIAAIVVLPRHARHRHVGFDWGGLALLAVGLLAVLIPIMLGRGAGWPWWTWASMAAGVVIVALFLRWESYVSGRGRTPIVPPELFHRRAFSAGVAVAFCFFASFTSLFFSFSLYWQAQLGHSALSLSLLSTPFAFGAILGSSQSARLTERFGRGLLLFGIGLLAVAFASAAVIVAAMPGEDLEFWMFMPSMLVAGIGNGVSISPNVQFVVAAVEPASAGAANGVLTTTQRLGAAIGVSLLATLFFGVGIVAAISMAVVFAIAGVLATLALPRRYGAA